MSLVYPSLLAEAAPTSFGHGTPAVLSIAVMAGSTAVGALLARRSTRQAALILVISSGMLLMTSLVDLLPEAWEDGGEAGLPVWQVPAIAIGGYAVMHIVTRNGCGCDSDLAKTAGAHAPGLHRQIKQAAGALSAGLGTAAALTTHRLFEGTALGLAFSMPLLFTLAMGSTSDGLALAAMLKETGQRLGPWLTVACASPAVGMLITSIAPLPAAALPVALALVAGVILRIAVIGFQLAAGKRKKGLLPRWHLITAAGTTAAMGALLLAAH
ncbi:hypothetical protein [Streptomyces sp. CdTB01]|uniref:hypothetical protein n=1 Tax=Streptomyces sp. CdTB01 TaxID=1725411 RepID=UPI00073A538C|nr:hypothetical protein [Streptomyces sp. CdTB01]ALV39209.1 hypothetical protein AS200_44710 [Streptomyces sp. CdTB01]